MGLLNKSKEVDLVHFLIILLSIITVPLTAPISFIIFIPVFIISYFSPSYGKFISYDDAWLDEDFESNIPGLSIVITLTLEGDLSLDELREHFTNKVLNARSKVNPKKLRYPELQQYLTTFLGFRIWKWDPNFQIENHIKEYNYDHLTYNQRVLENIHQKYLNKPYEKLKSPWELVLIKDINVSKSNCEQKSILVFRVHHVMADAKSLLKLFVECLGKQKLKTAKYQAINQHSTWEKLKFIVAFPRNYLLRSVNFWSFVYNCYDHPFSNVSNYGKLTDEHLKTVVAFSPKLEMSDIKKVAVKHNVKTSAVVMSIIAGAVRKSCEDKWDKDVVIGYVLPRANHPEFLTNHAHAGILSLPTDESCRFKRLELCNQRFVQMKVDRQYKYTDVHRILVGNQVHSVSRISTILPLPITITNIAGEEEGFSVGKAECRDFLMSVGTSHRSVGVVFCTMSYKGGLGIAVIAKESIMKKEAADNIAQYLALELKLLMQ